MWIKKEETKLSLFMDDMFAYIEKSKIINNLGTNK